MGAGKKLNSSFNVVLLTVDSLRADFLGCYNKDIRKEKISPNMDKWADDAILFLYAITQSSHTSPAFLAMLSGNYPSKYGDWFTNVSEKRPMISEIFKSNGYHTSAFNSNPYISNFYGFNRGFDVFVDNMPKLGQGKSNKNFSLKFNMFKALIREPYETASIINSQAISWLKKVSIPYFMWVHYMDVHGPYISKKGWVFKNRMLANILWKKALHRPEKITENERKTLIETYKEEIIYMDSQIGELLRNIDNDNTIIIITADHGDLFGEHNLFGHTLKLYNGLLHVPLLIKLPTAFNCKNRHIQTPVRSVDIVPTLVEILHLRTRDYFDGRSLWSLLNGTGYKYQCDYVISEVSRKHLCIQKDGWKLIVDYKNNSKELYNLLSDPEEKLNLVNENKKIVEELESLIKKHLIMNRSCADTTTKAIAHNEEIKERLKALGYID